ncbi:UDP-N-acetylmuramoyl-L-alanyl-D-glutamate--2,6-diaminopimelate ligase [Aquisalimonas sp.]|uniref:UDP-N-acetylmuramoyl-L-alanyl-D-glutamate--2, 6-diaminopimelate ligase n=1 Tax=Aquisalimonas sp. TaxID=1872621 RepID=UPI0025BDA5B9|nr:UDP-N-acetylmuramoyl-L-alanyl-D-glutamate--2,6-diaminopimelate ligase [Aquisalimonas sp.]
MSAAFGQPDWISLGAVLEGYAQVAPAQDVPIRAFTVDSRRVCGGAAFVALPGSRVHGLDYLPEALNHGPAAVVCDPNGAPDLAAAEQACVAAGVAFVPLNGLSAALGELAARVHGHPAERLCTVGVTGTDGKTSVSQFLARALDVPERRCAVIGTLGAGFPDALQETGLTTPDAATVQALLRDLLERGAFHVAMEVSSHALTQHRVAGIPFDTAVLTNLGRDHLDYHPSAQAYADAKCQLFRMDGLRLAVLNADDALGRRLHRELRPTAVDVLSYSLDASAKAEVMCTSLQSEPDGLRMHVATPVGTVAVRAPLLGRFNAANVLAVIGVLVGQGMTASTIETRLARLQPVPGRMEPIVASAGPLAVVDYAHTPGALRSALVGLRQHVTGQLWCVFGCGGDRDAGKRALMGAAAERLADRLIITDDNPRTENPDAIVSAINAGLRRPHAARIIRDRAEAITTALREAAPGDAVLIAGKGHETYQITATGRHFFSDRETVRRVQAGGEP